MVIAVPADQLEQSLNLLNSAGESAWHIGSIASANKDEEQVVIND